MKTTIAFLSAALLSLVLTSHAGAQCTFDPAETTALIDLTGMYQGETGGLYGDGSNVPPPALFSDARSRAEAIAPIDGSVVMISVGMSNTTQEFSSFVPMAMAYPDVNPALVVVDGAQGGRPANAWSDASADTWGEVDRRLRNAGVSPNQVQVAWIKQAMAGPRDAFPLHAQTLQGHLEGIARALRTNYPNIQLAFFSSRTRACTNRGLNPEPFAYESAFSVRWLIDAQQSGDAMLDPDTRAPLIAWGPYLWAQEAPRSDGFSWPCSSTRDDDCTHPSTSGRTLVAGLLLDFFTSDPLATPWFLREGTAPPLDAGGVDGGVDAGGVDAGMADAGATDGGRGDAATLTDSGGLDSTIGGDAGGAGSDAGESGSGGGCSTTGAASGSLVWLVFLASRRKRR